MTVDLAKFVTVGPPGTEQQAPHEPSPADVDLAKFVTVGPPEPEAARAIGTEAGLGGEFEAGVGRGINQLRSSFLGLTSIVAESFDSDAIRKFAEEGLDDAAEIDRFFQGNVPTLESIENGGDFFRWSAGIVGEQVPILATVFGGGGIGAAIAKRAAASSIRGGVRASASKFMRETGQNITEREIADAITRQLADPVMNRMMQDALIKGAVRGAVVPAFGLEAGGIQNELVEAGISAPLTAVVGGLAAASLEALPVANLIGRMFPGVDAVLAKSFVSGVAKTMGVQALLEGSTEGAQEVVALAARAFHDPSFDINTPANRQRIIEAAAAGALVGSVTGGLGQTASSISRRVSKGSIPVDPEGSGKMRDFVTGRIKPITDGPLGTAPEADTLFPGINEVRVAAAAFVADTVSPMLASVRNKAAAGLDSVREALGDGVNVASLGRTIDEIDETLRSRVGPELDFLNERVNFFIDDMIQRGATIRASERAQFIGEQLKALKTDILKWADERIRPFTERSETDLEGQIRTADYGDEDTLFDEGIFPRDTQRVVFGQSTRVSRDLGGTPVTSRVRTRDDDAIPFTSREGADNAVADVRRLMPNLEADAIEVIDQDDGFVIAVNDIGKAEEIFEQLRFNDGLREAAESSRVNPDLKRRVGVRRPGATGITRMDLPTLAFIGADIAERGDVRVPQNLNKRAVLGLDTVIARMLDQGFEFVGGVGALNNKTLLETRDGGRLTVKQGRARAQFVPDEQGTAERDRGPVFDQPSAAEEIPTRQAGVSETEAGLNRASKKAPNSRERIVNAQRYWTPRPRTSVAFTSVPEGVQNSLMDMIEDMIAIVGLRTRVLVVDKGAAARLFDEDHPMHAQIERAMSEDPAARIITQGPEAVIYVSERVLIDQVNGDEEVARLNTFATVAHELGHLVEFAYFDRLSNELKDRLKTAHEQSGSGNTFEEWMANQFVGWAARNQAPRSAIEEFFQSVVDALRRVFDMLTAKFALDETFEEFMDGVVGSTNDTAINDFARHFLNEGVTGHVWFGLPANEADFEIPIPRVSTDALNRIREALENYPGVKQAAIRTWEMMLAFHTQFTQTLNGRLRDLGYNASDKLADMFNRTPGLERENPTYFNNVQFFQALFANQFNKILRPDGKPISEERMQAAISELIENDGRPDGAFTNPDAIAISKVFAELYDYLRDKGLPIERIENYFPRIWDAERVRDNDTRIRELLTEAGVPVKNMEQMIDWMASTGNEAEFQSNIEDPLSDLPYEGFIQDRSEVLNDPRFNEFRSRDLNRIVERYLSAAVKRAEYNEFFGEDSVGVGEWNPRAKLEGIIDDAMEEGATQKEVQFMLDSVDAALGRYGRTINPNVRAGMAWIATYQNMRLLLFSTLASLPDIVGPAIRSNSFRDAFNTMRNGMSDIVNKESDLNEMARTWGIISDQMNQHILTEHFDSHWFPERARGINEKFFRAIGLERWTNFTRSAALAVGVDFIKRKASEANNGDTKAAADLAQLGLTAENVTEWIEGGEQTFGAGGYNSQAAGAQNEHNQKVAQSMIQFVNESVMKPNPSQRPLWASNPAFMLIFHLKSFMYSFHETITRQIAQNMREAGTPWQKAYALAAPGLMLLAFTGLGLELRELIQYKIWGRPGRTDRMDGPTYALELIERSGITGPSQLAFDFEGAEDRGQLGFVAIAGPALGQLTEIISRPISQTGPKAIPGISQIPELRELVRDVTPL